MRNSINKKTNTIMFDQKILLRVRLSLLLVRWLISLGESFHVECIQKEMQTEVVMSYEASASTLDSKGNAAEPKTNQCNNGSLCSLMRYT